VKVVHTVDDVRAALADAGSVGLVPTMGALHAGHEALLGAARPACDTLVMSLFVNPTQFDDPGDLDAYPRDLDRDLELAEAAGVDVVFAPAAAELYPPGFATWVVPEGAALGLEADHRAGHFRGVATVCLLLFLIVRPRIAWFGRKDAQQVAVLKQLVRDLRIELDLRVVDTVRDPDGLALSSRNARLTPAERARALAIPRALATRDPDQAQAVLDAAGVEVEYAAVADLDGPTLAIAARVGGIRLIDNLPLRGAPA
jgi:pantoate--beta-alanine ligase